jgi:putative flippase GtrA
MKPAARLVMLYIIFAGVAIMVNLGSQALVIALYSGTYAVGLSILFGTGTGLLVKYILDKRHIFEFTSDNLAHDGRLFVLYTLMGVFTTALFWGVEYAFQWLFGTDTMRYLGGFIGLTLGYIIKYRLDKHFVFVSRRPAPTEAI